MGKVVDILDRLLGQRPNPEVRNPADAKMPHEETAVAVVKRDAKTILTRITSTKES